MSNSDRGFTLTELSLLLTIVSLMLATTVKAAEWLDVGNLRSAVRDFREVPVLLESYRRTYGQLPGDDAAAGTRFGMRSVSATAGNGTIEGGWNSEDESDESYLVWQHLRAAGLAGGPPGAEGGEGGARRLPVNAFGGRVGVQDGADGPIAGLAARHLVCSAGIPAQVAARLDSALDDGVPGTGRMRSARDPAPSSVFRPGITPARQAVPRYVDGDRITVCMGF